jgi:DNA topoisomerase-3
MSEKILVIAEKPSVAGDITKVLPDKFKKEKTHYEGERYIVSYAVGHLLTICEPGEISEKFKSWTLKTLPIIPEQFPLKPISKSETQLKALLKFIKKKEVTHIINACDAGREGELIFRYIIDYASMKGKTKKKISRLWLQSMTPDAIRKAFEELRSNEEMFSLADAARSRSEADWLIGINGSRGLTAYNSQFGGFHLTPCGRVQTPTLGMLVEREKQREAFVSRDYWNLLGEFAYHGKTYSGKWFDPKFKKSEKDPQDSADKIWDEKKALEIAEKCNGKQAVVTESTKSSTQKCPPLYDLTSLQREANNRFGFPAKMTLSVAQSIYDKYKLITYPRTDSRYLPEDYLNPVKDLMGVLSAGEYGRFAKEAVERKYIKNEKRIFNNQKISDHFAIIPTSNLPKKLPERELKIYTMILQRFIAVFFPAAEFLNTTRISEVEGETFKTEGKILKVPGWKAVYQQETAGEKLLEPLTKEAKPILEEIQVKKDATRPPARFSESTLLSAMENAGKMVEDEELKEAMKERGLGTPATRAAIIEKLMTDKYVVREDRELLPTSKAFDLFRLINAMDIVQLKSPELTGEWEYKLGLIEKGEMTRAEFMKQIEESTKTLVASIKNFDEEKTRKEADFSPLNGIKWYETLSRFYSEDGEYAIRKILGGRRMAPGEIKTLVQERKLGPLEGFRSKRGRPFTASIILNDSNKVEFVFSGGEEDTETNLQDAEVIGKSPIDDSPVYKTLNAYVSDSALHKSKNGIRINRVILGKEITEENMKRMLAGEKTELIQGFRSKKTNRLFDAYLELTKTGKIRFSFPPRKKKTQEEKEESKKAK